jgi:hypothetical protein
MKSILKKTSKYALAYSKVSLEREIELTQDLFWMFTEERLKTLQQEDVFEEFLTLLDQLIESEAKRAKRVHFATKDDIRTFEKDIKDSPTRVLLPPSPYHPAIHLQNPYY